MLLNDCIEVLQYVYIERIISIVLELKKNITLIDLYSTTQLYQTYYELQCNVMKDHILQFIILFS